MQTTSQAATATAHATPAAYCIDCKPRCIGTGIKTAGAALALVSGDGSAGSGDAAWARLTDGIELLTDSQVHERFAAEGMQVSADFVAQLRVEAVKHGPRRELAIFPAQQERTIGGIHENDGADHGASVSTSQPLSQRERQLVLALQAIVLETMHYSPVRPTSADSFLPEDLVAAAQRALATCGCAIAPTRSLDAASNPAHTERQALDAAIDSTLEPQP